MKEVRDSIIIGNIKYDVKISDHNEAGMYVRIYKANKRVLELCLNDPNIILMYLENQQLHSLILGLMKKQIGSDLPLN